MEGKPLVCITGITGFVGIHVCKVFLESGQFKVRGTVRDTKNQKKMEPLKKAFGALFDQLELVEADLNKQETLSKAIEGCEYLVHTASPFVMGKPKNEMDIIGPAVNGTKYAVEAAIANKVKRVVITSSTVAMAYVKDPNKTHFNENDWTEVESPMGKDAYFKSKTLAEKKAWDLQAEAKANGQDIEICTVNPGLITGPNYNAAKFTSGDIIKAVVESKFQMVPAACIQMVDVRDVANAHLQCLLKPDAGNKRFILVDCVLYYAEINDMVMEVTNNHYKMKKASTLPKGMFSCIGTCCCKADARQMVALWGKKFTFDTSQTEKVLGIKTMPIDQSIKDMIPALQETKYIHMPGQKKLPNHK